MKKLLMMATAVAFSAVMAQSAGITPAFAEDQGAPPAAQGQQRHGGGGQGQGQGNDQQRQEKFNEMKTKILQKIQDRETKIAQMKSCVQSATTPDALRACMPKREGRGGEGGREGGWKHGDGDNGGGFMRHRGGGDGGGDNGGSMPDGGSDN